MTIEDSKALEGNPGPSFLDTARREFRRAMGLPKKML